MELLNQLGPQAVKTVFDLWYSHSKDKQQPVAVDTAEQAAAPSTVALPLAVDAASSLERSTLPVTKAAKSAASTTKRVRRKAKAVSNAIITAEDELEAENANIVANAGMQPTLPASARNAESSTVDNEIRPSAAAAAGKSTLT
jgi:hypothetical protein